MDYRQFHRHIKSRDFKNLYLLYGEEDYLKDYFTAEIIKEMMDCFGPGAELIKYTDRPEPSALQENFNTLSMLGGVKIILLRKTGIFSAEKGSSDKYLFLEQLPGHCHVICVEDNVKKNMKLYKIFDKQGICAEFNRLKGDELNAWVIKEFSRRGKIISPAVAAYFVNTCEEDMYSIYNEICKLAEFTDNAEISTADVDYVTSKAIKSIIFDLTNSISAGNSQKAYEVLNELESRKEPLQRVFFMLCRHLRYLKLTRDLMAERITASEAGTLLKLKPYEASKFYEQCRSFDSRTLEKALEDCVNYDIAIKNGKMDVRTAIELLIANYGNRQQW